MPALHRGCSVAFKFAIRRPSTMKMHLIVCLLACVVGVLAAQSNVSVSYTEDPSPATSNSTSYVTDLDGSTEELVRQKLDGEDFYKTTKEIYIHFIIALPIFALLTNSLSLFVFIMRGKKEQTVNMLLIALTISDMLSLVNIIDVAWYYQANWSLQQRTHAGCKLIQYVANAARDCSSWLILTFTVDRFVAVWFPLKHSSIMTKRRVQFLMLGDVALACALGDLHPCNIRLYQARETSAGLRP